MKLRLHPKAAALLCAVVVLACAAAPAVFLTAMDMAAVGRSAAVADPYIAPTPQGEDYYILRQLAERRRQQENTYNARPREERRDLSFYVGAQSSLQEMSNGYAYQETVAAALQNLVDCGAIDPVWAAWAGDWTAGEAYTDYSGTVYYLDNPYYTTDSLGFVTLKRFAMEQGTLYTAFSMTMDSRTGVVTQLWISAPRTGEAEAAGTGAAVLVESTDGTTTPPAPDEAALRAFADQAGLENLGDWAVPQDSPYPNALYSQNGEALITASVNAYDYSGWTDTAGIVTSPRWFLSLSLQPCTAEELPSLVL